MENYTVLAITHAKLVFQVVKTTGLGKLVYNKKVNSEKLKEFLRKETKELVVMDARGKSHYLCRYAQLLGHE